MTVAILVVLCCACALVVGLGVEGGRRWARLQEPAERAFERISEPEPEVERLISERRAIRVVVTQTDGESFVGLIADWDTGWLLLRECESLGPQGSRIGVDGELLLPRDRVAYIQRP